MTDTEQDRCAKDGENEPDKNFHEYAIITQGLLRDLEACKEEQTRCRMELETLSRESKHAARVARDTFSHANTEKCTENQDYQESLENLQKRISIMEMEKETIFQMWQMSLKTIDSLEEELKSSHRNGGTAKYYEEQINGVRETYTEAIKALESKLMQAKENFVKNQALWELNREKMEILSRERNEFEKKFSILQGETRSREETNVRLIESLRTAMEISRNELEKSRDEKLELHEKLREARNYATRAIAKDEESKCKVSEALEIAETAIREKETALQRESRALEEKSRLESRLNIIVEEWTTRLDRESTAARETSERVNKKYILEVKELKIELREKVTIIERLERENGLLEEELEKVRHGYEDFLQRSSANVLELEKKLKESNLRSETCEENFRIKYEEMKRQDDERITELEARLATSGDRLRKIQFYDNKDLEERIREADERTKEIVERHSLLERRLARTLDERENIASEMRTLRGDFDREIARRDNERRSQEARIRELRDNLQNANNALEKSNAHGVFLAKQIESMQQDVQDKRCANGNGNEARANEELMLRLKALQDKFDLRTKELSQHVEIHQKLCGRWKDEAKSLTAKFQIRSKEFREKMRILRKENEELTKELIVCRQQLAHCRIHVSNRVKFAARDEGEGETQTEVKFSQLHPSQKNYRRSVRAANYTFLQQVCTENMTREMERDDEADDTSLSRTFRGFQEL